MKTLKKIALLLVLAFSFGLSMSSCVVGYYGPAPYRAHTHPSRYHGYGYYHHSQYGSYHRGIRHYSGRPHRHYGPR